MDIEIWKAIPEFTGYEASTLGRIRSYRCQGNGLDWTTEPKILKHKVSSRGYHSVRIRHDDGRIVDMRVNRLVLLAHVGPCPPGMVACHFPDPTKANNRLDNLRWDTQQANFQDALIHGTKDIFSNEQIAEIIRMDEAGTPRSVIADHFGVNRPRITKVLVRRGIMSSRPYKPPHIMSESDLNEAQRMSDSGMTHKEIGKVLGVSRPTVTRWLARSAAQLA